jgi:hypothetical protein
VEEYGFDPGSQLAAQLLAHPQLSEVVPEEVIGIARGEVRRSAELGASLYR